MTHPLSKPQINMVGQRFGRLVAMSWVVGGDKQWLCACDCGGEAVVRGGFLRSGKTKSCGCLKREKMAAGLSVRHGMNGTRTYKSWDSMVRRCTSKGDATYWRYGGAGIVVCERWLRFDEFFADMGERPAGTTLDRIDCHGNYEPQNCRWASATVQANNRSNNRKISYNGTFLTIRELCELTGANYPLMRGRILRQGWDAERAVQTPVKQKGNNA